MSRRFAILIVLVAVGAAATHASAQASSPASSRSSIASGMRHQINLAQSDLFRAYAAANRDDALSAEVKQAQQNMIQARRDYNAALAAAKAAIPVTPQITALRQNVQDLQDTLSAEHDVRDWSVRLAAASDLMSARTQLNAIENAATAGDADLAVAKATVSDTNAALQDAVARRQSLIQQDPQVVAARQRLDGLRHQMLARR